MMDELLTLGELAAYLKVAKSTIYRLIKKNELPAFKLGERDWRFNRSAIDRWRMEKESAFRGSE